MFAQRALGNAYRVFGRMGASTSNRYSSKLVSANILVQRSVLPSTAVPEFRRFSTKTESTLVDFLKEEIEAEKKLSKQQLAGAQQPGIPGFKVESDQREVLLSKQHGSEKVTVTFDVNHTVDSDAGSETEGKAPEQSQETPAMVSKPNFTVEVEKGGQKLVFECAFVEPDYGGEEQANPEEYVDLFNIEEIYMYTGEKLTDNNKIYAVSGGIIDGTLYDHLMNYLSERGIDNDFAQNLSRYATFYEHGQYVSLLQKLRDFVSH